MVIFSPEKKEKKLILGAPEYYYFSHWFSVAVLDFAIDLVTFMLLINLFLFTSLPGLIHVSEICFLLHSLSHVCFHALL